METPDTDDRTQCRAICEQALFLLTRGAECEDLEREEIDGVGARTYRRRANWFLAPRAQALLLPLLRRQMGKLSRG